MKPIDKFILYTSIFALFSESFKFHFVINLKLFYVIILLNSLLLITKKSYYLNTKHLLILGILILHGVIIYTFNQNNIIHLVSQIIGISISSFYYYNFIRCYGTELVIDLYLKFAYVIALLALPMLFFSINMFDHRLNGIMTEPAHYATIMIPALYVLFRRKKHFWAGVILITILLSRSSLGFIGLILIAILPILKPKYIFRLSIVLLLGGFVIGNYLANHWNENFGDQTNNQVVRRVKQTYNSFITIKTGKFKQDTNLSSYALISNMFITKTSFLNAPLGTGIGSYASQYDKYFPNMSPPSYLRHSTLIKVNREDANSLFLRLLVDLGVFAFLLLFYFLWRGFNVSQKKEGFMQQGTFIYLILKLIREGHYFPPELYFFLILFLKDFNENTTYSGRLLP